MELISFVIYASIYIGLIATTFYVLSFMADAKKKKQFFEEDEFPKVSVIIPAYNEEESIEKTIKSVLKSDYSDFEVIVIDDGSEDNTYKIAKRFSSKKVRVFTKKNGGKGSALNFGISKAKGEVVITMDADTFVASHSMKKMMRYFKNENVMSVTPAMIISNPRTILQRIQHIEYLLGLFLRKAFSSVNSIYITPGAFSAYRKSFFEKYGGYDVGNITEDLEIALRIQFNGYLIANCPEAPAYTEAPRKFKELTIQRRRWYYGLIKNTWTYRKIISSKYGDMGLFVMPIAWISIVLAVFITIYLFIKTLFEVKKELLFLQSINFDFANLVNVNFYAVERILFLFFTSPVILFVLLFMLILGAYMYYAARKIGKVPGLIINLPLFYLFFAILFGFWWIVSIFYAIFAKSIKWR